MKKVSISGSPRANVGKKDAKALRDNGNVPCVLYGGKEQVFFSAPEKQFKQLVYTPDAHQVTLDIEGKSYHAIMQDIQFHRINDKIVHADFLEVVPGKPVTMSIPVKTSGVSEGVKSGGKLLKKLRRLQVRGNADQMPDDVTLDITTLKIGDSIRVADIKLDGLTILDSPNATVLAVKVTRNVATPEEEAAEAEGGEAAEGEGGETAKEAAAEEKK